MTTYIDFQPSSQGPFQFSPTLDGDVYNAVVTWNVFGQRYYVSLYDLQSNLIVCLPMIGSPPAYDISLTAGYFDSTLVFRQASNQFEVNP